MIAWSATGLTPLTAYPACPDILPRPPTFGTEGCSDFCTNAIATFIARCVRTRLVVIILTVPATAAAVPTEAAVATAILTGSACTGVNQSSDDKMVVDNKSLLIPATPCFLPTPFEISNHHHPHKLHDQKQQFPKPPLAPLPRHLSLYWL